MREEANHAIREDHELTKSGAVINVSSEHHYYVSVGHDPAWNICWPMSHDEAQVDAEGFRRLIRSDVHDMLKLKSELDARKRASRA